MQLFTNFNLLNKTAFSIGLWCLAFSILLIFFILLFRIFSIRKKYEIILFYRTWNPIFNNINFSIPSVLPKVKKSNQFHLLKIFNKTFEKTPIEFQENLLKIANHLEIVNIAKEMVDYNNSIYKIVAIKTIGYLKIQSVSTKLNNLIEHENIVIKLISAQSLIKISSSNLDKLIPFLILEEECHVNKIILILSNFDKEEIWESIKKSIDNTSVELMPRLIKLFNLLDKPQASIEAKKLLLKYKEIEIVSTLIPFISDKNEKTFLFSFLDDESWIIRMQAIKSLNGMLQIEDIKTISKLLLDSSWWVRHHTANAIVSISSMTDNYLDNLEEVLGDKFAIDTLRVARKRRSLFDSI